MIGFRKSCALLLDMTFVRLREDRAVCEIWIWYLEKKLNTYAVRTGYIKRAQVLRRMSIRDFWLRSLDLFLRLLHLLLNHLRPRSPQGCHLTVTAP